MSGPESEPIGAVPDPSPPAEEREQSEARVLLEEALVEVKRVIAGQDEMLERVLVCLVAGGHLLIEGVPGLAKTLTIKTTAAVLGGSFKRIQFTPDLVPSDLVGTRVYRSDQGGFDTELGPVFCNFLLAARAGRLRAGADHLGKVHRRDRDRGHLHRGRQRQRHLLRQDPATVERRSGDCRRRVLS